MASAETILANTGTPRADPGGHGETNRVEPTVPNHREAPKINLSQNPGDEELRKVSQIRQLFQLAANHRRPMVGRWNECYRMYRNRYWDLSTRASWLPSPMLSEIKPIVESLVSWEMDQSPTYTVSPFALPHTDFHRFFNDISNDLEAVLDASYIVNAEEIEWAKAQLDKYKYGTGFVKTTWDMTLAGGLGDSITRRVSPFSIYPDPQATDTTDWNYVVEARRMSIQELDRRWPGTAALFPGGGLDFDVDLAPTQIGNGAQPPRVNPGAMAPATASSYGQPGVGRNAKASILEIPGVTVLEAWIREHETYKADDLNTGEAVTKVYDTWRVVVVAGNRVIMDEPADNLWSHGGHPYDRLVVRDTGEFWGESLVEDLISAQKAYNRILAALQANVELTGNPPWKDVAGMTRGTTTNRPGQKIAVPAGAAKDAGYVQPPQMHQAMPLLMQHYPQWMERFAGLTAVMKGASPAGRNAQGVIDALQESGFVRVRSSLKFLEAAMRNAGTKKADLIIENYTTPRLVAVAGPGGERSSLALKARRFQIPSSGGQIPLKYQLLVDVGSRRHTSRQMREDRAVQLFTLDAIDRTALLDDLDYPNAQVVADRLEEHDRQMAAMGELQKPGARQRARA